MWESIKELFKLYGGWAAIRSSSYIRWALVLTLINWRSIESESWSANAIAIVPPVLGFSIAALAIITAIGDEKFRNTMAKVDVIKQGESDLTVVMASICWFIIIQIFSVLYAITYSSKPFISSCHFFIVSVCYPMDWWFNIAYSILGQFTTIYSTLLIISSIFQMFNLYRLYIGNIRKQTE